MKKIITTLTLSLFIGILAVSAATLENGTTTNSNSKKAKSITNVKVYYFHGTYRCPTCLEVEAISKNSVKEYYGDKIKFESVNFEKDQNKSLVDKYKIAGQTLLIVKGNKLKNLTNYAFMNVMTNPYKLKAKIKNTIDSIM